MHAVITMLAVVVVWSACAHSVRNEKGTPMIGTVAATSPGIDTILLQTHREFTAHFAGSSDDLNQIQCLLSDAIVRLLGSFEGMHQLVLEQRAVSVFVMQFHGGNGENSIADMLSETSDSMNTLANSMVNNGEVGLELVEKMEGISQQVQGILHVRGELDTKERVDVAIRCMRQIDMNMSQAIVAQSEVASKVDAVVANAVMRCNFRT